MSSTFSLSSGFFDDARALVSLILPNDGASTSSSPCTSGYFGSHPILSQDDRAELRDYQVNQKYKKKYSILKKHMLHLITVNAACCDEIADVQDKILMAIGKRKALTKKLLNFQTATETYNQLQLTDSGAGLSSLASGSGTSSKKTPVKKRGCDTTKITKESIKTKEGPKSTKEYGKAKVAKDQSKLNKEVIKPVPKPRKAAVPKSNPTKKLVQPIPVNSYGRPIFPIVLRDLVIHSLGEIVHDRPAYHTKEMFFPVGFCSSRVYGSTKCPEARCVYTCKVLDGGPYPKFQMSGDDMDEPLVGDSLNFCHLVIIQQINQYFRTNLVSNFARGAEFFGFNHPTVLNLLQKQPGSKKCLKYKTTRFEVSQTGEVPFEPNDPRLNYQALQQIIDVPKPGYRVRFEDDCF